MLTKDGLLTALESTIENEITVGLYVNEPDGDAVLRSDLEESKNYQPQKLNRAQWAVDEQKLEATADRVVFKFSGKAGKIVGYFLEARGRVITYEPFMDPLPVNTNEDVIRVRPRIMAKRLVA